MIDNVTPVRDAMTVKAGSDTPSAFYGHAQANPLPLQQGQQQLNTPVSVWQQQTFTSTDALLGELLRQVLEMRRDVEALQAAMTDLAGALREKPRPAIPPNALRHSR